MMSNAFPLLDGAVVHLFRSPIQSFSDSYTCFTNYGWFDPKGVENTNGPNCNVAEGFVVQNPGPPTHWIGNFVANRPATSPVPTMPINRLQISGGTAILEWADPGGGGLHDIQFSTDRATWITIATRQSGVIWTGNLPAPVAGFFQVIASNKEGRAN